MPRCAPANPGKTKNSAPPALLEVFRTQNVVGQRFRGRRRGVLEQAVQQLSAER
jgi:hypothetical protein